jgi:hypothetical protein
MTHSSPSKIKPLYFHGTILLYGLVLRHGFDFASFLILRLDILKLWRAMVSLCSLCDCLINSTPLCPASSTEGAYAYAVYLLTVTGATKSTTGIWYTYSIRKYNLKKGIFANIWENIAVSLHLLQDSRCRWFAIVVRLISLSWKEKYKFCGITLLFVSDSVFVCPSVCVCP